MSEAPLFLSKSDGILFGFYFPSQAHEDPMYELIRENKRNEKETRYGFASG